MKKTYIKPVLAVEHYELTQTIATCTGVKVGFADSQCVLTDADTKNNAYLTGLATVLFAGADLAGTKPSCTVSPMMGDKYDGLCYHTSVNAIFTS